MSNFEKYHELEEYRNAIEALRGLANKLAEAPNEDWRASLAWESVQEVSEKLTFDLFDAFCGPHRPENFRHWREKPEYSTEVQDVL